MSESKVAQTRKAFRKLYQREGVEMGTIEQEEFQKMLERAGIGHGLRIDHDGTAVLVETGESETDFTITEFWFNENGLLKSVDSYPGEAS